LDPLRFEHLVQEALVDERTLLDGTSHGLTLLTTTTDDELLGRLVDARLVTLGRHAPRRARVTATRAATLATAHRVVDGVHGDAAVGRALPHQRQAAGLAPRVVAVVGVADGADGGAAAQVHEPHLARRQADGAPVAFLGHELRRGAGRARQLAAGADLQLDVV